LPSEAGRFWRSATPAQRAGLAAFAIICVGLLALAGSLAGRPDYAVLYADLQPEDAAKVVERLRELKIPYRVRSAGTVEVPADSIHEVRLDLAAEGLPAGGQRGFELFDRTQLGLTDFGERMNYQRALQGELARTIAHLEAVHHARVHLALPAERLYARDEEKPTASVVLGLRRTGGLDRSQVSSIVHLVSGAVEGLAPESVAVLDTTGRLLSSPDRRGEAAVGVAAASGHFQLRRAYERQVEAAVQSMLDGVLGPRKAMVRASADISFDRIERESESYDPAADGAGVLTSRTEAQESYRGGGEPAALGVPGVSSNTGAGSTGAAIAPTGEVDQYQHSESTTQYLVSRRRERTIHPPGEVKQLSLSVFIDEEIELGEGEDLDAAVAAAAGLDPERGDAVVITRLPFQPPPAEEGGSAVYAVRDFYRRVGRDFAAILLAVAFLWFVRGLIRRRQQPLMVPPAAPPAAGAAAASAPASAPASAQAMGPQEAPQAPVPEVAIDPERAAAVLRTWLASEEAPPGEAGAQSAQHAE
jgi:flagellar M-ring protein FliF